MPAINATVNDPIERAAAGAMMPSMADGVDALSVTLLRAGDITDALRTEWRALAETAAAPNPYFVQWFLEPAMKYLDPDGEVRLVLLRRADDGLLVGLAPFVFQKGYAKLPLKHVCVWTHRHCYNGAPLIRDGFAVAAYAALFDWVDTRPEGSVFIRFAMLPFDGESHGVLDEACALRDRAFRVQDYHERAILTAENEIDAVLTAAMSGKKRKELRRLERRFDELGTVALSSVPVTEGDTISDFLALESAGWKTTNPDGFPLAQSVAESRFFREAMALGAEEGAVACLSLTLDGAPKAMLVTLRIGSHLAAFKTTYDESLSSFSPGVRVLIEATRAMLDSDAEVFDSCARQGHPVVDGLWSERLPIVQINVPARRAADKTLLRTAATLEKMKNGALRRLNRKEA
jgi:CelD/BcsL family acetyltransferase involved in cellulose biosynthesis